MKAPVQMYRFPGPGEPRGSVGSPRVCDPNSPRLVAYPSVALDNCLTLLASVSSKGDGSQP